MPDIMVLLACLSQCVEPTPLRQLGRVTEAMLAMSGRVTMRGLSRWAGKGGSYRTIQRSFNTSLSWGQLQWLLIRQHLLDADEVVVMSGDYVVVTKAGKMTYGLDRFFSSLVWQGGARAVFSEFIPAQCQAPYVLPGGDRTRRPARQPLKPSQRRSPRGNGDVPKGARIATVGRWNSAHRSVLSKSTSRAC